MRNFVPKMGFATVAMTSVVAPGCFWLGRNERHVAERVLERRDTAPVTSAPAERVVLDYRLVDQSAGDPFAVDSLWAIARCPLSHEKAALLAENGIRVGLVSGLIPPEFIARVTNERYLIDPRALATGAGEEKVIPVNGPIESATVRLVKSWAGQADERELADVECGLTIRGVSDPRGPFRLTCTPTVQFGSKESWLKPTADRTQFVWERQKTRESLATLAWDVSIGPGEYLIVGPTDRPAGTLGELFFFHSEPARVRQRFLVVRGRAEAGPGKVTDAVAARAVATLRNADDFPAVLAHDGPPGFGR